MKGQIELLDYLASLMQRPIDITGYIPVGSRNAIRREMLSSITGLSDRKMRAAIHYARRNTAILNLSDGDGYFIPDLDDPVDRKALIRFVRQEERRLRSIAWALYACRKILREHGIDWRSKDAA